MTVAASIEIGTRALPVIGGSRFPTTMQDHAAASMPDDSGTASFRSRWQSLIESQNPACDVDSAASGKQPLSDPASSIPVQGARETAANAGDASSGVASGSTQRQTQKSTAGKAVLGDGHAAADGNEHVSVGAKAANSSTEPDLDGASKGSSKRGKLESTTALEPAVNVVVLGIGVAAVPTNIVVAAPVQPEANFTASSVEVSADRTESAAWCDAKALVTATGTTKDLESSGAMQQITGVVGSTRISAGSNLGTPGAHDSEENSQTPEHLDSDGEEISSKNADFQTIHSPEHATSGGPTAGSATASSGAVIPESFPIQKMASAFPGLDDGDSGSISGAAAVAEGSHEVNASPGSNAVSLDLAHAASSISSAITVPARKPDAPTTGAKPVAQVVTGDSQATANSMEASAPASSLGVQAAPAASAPAAVDGDSATGRSPIIESTPKDGSIAGAVSAASVASESNESPSAKSNAPRTGRSPSAALEHATDRTPDRITEHVAHLAGGLVYGDEISTRQPEKADHGGLNPMLVHDLAGMTLSSGGGHAAEAHAVSANVGGFSGRDTFAALDAETASPPTTWIQAGTRRAEAGYQDPALGWVGVRAQSDGSGVHAAVVPGSAEAAQALNGHLTGLNAFMVEHHGHGSTVTLAAPESAHAEGTQYGSGQQQGNPGRQEANSREPNSQSPIEAGRGQSASLVPTNSASQIDGFVTTAASPGIHISVVA